ncbi:MAG TPA: nucleoside recognition domain-containing protein [Ignavibacteriaceae bacterium]|nr:nucleoside recognition domain-containing protein [Ignavibacteriaceae bacterium]
MLNYIWLGLIFLGLAAALSTDLQDKATNKYQSGNSIPITFYADSSIDYSHAFDTKVTIDKKNLYKYYQIKSENDLTLSAKVSINENKSEASFFALIEKTAPDIFQKMAKVSGKENDLTGTIKLSQISNLSLIEGTIVFEEVSFLSLKEVTNSALSYAETAVNIALGLIGVMALWLGVMKIAEEAGLITYIARALKPITKFLFPEVPSEHPAMGAMIMNISANFLGLGNAATPFGLKAMEELDKLNQNKGTATNAMCTFLAVNTAGMTLIPATAIAIRASAGSSEPAVIIGTALFGSTCATITGITVAKIMEKFPIRFSEFGKWLNESKKFLISLFAIGLVAAIILLTGIGNSISSFFNFINPELIKNIIQVVSIIAIPFLITVFIGFGAYKKVKVYETFVEGAKEGFNVAIRIIPYLVAMLMAIGIFRTGGAMDWLIYLLKPLTNFIGMPAEALPMALMRPLSGSGSLGIMAEIISVHGPDSFIGILVSTFFGSTETTFYVLAVYFGSVGIKRIRHAVVAGIMADIVGILAAVFIVTLLFG